MLTAFKNLLNEKGVKHKSISAIVRAVYPKHMDEGSFTEYILWVELDDKYIILARTPNKWGEGIDLVKESKDKTDELWDLDDSTQITEKLLIENDLSIYEIAQEAYDNSHIFIHRTINSENITKEDVDYMTKNTIKLLRKYEEQKEN